MSQTEQRVSGCRPCRTGVLGVSDESSGRVVTRSVGADDALQGGSCFCQNMGLRLQFLLLTWWLVPGQPKLFPATEKLLYSFQRFCTSNVSEGTCNNCKWDFLKHMGSVPLFEISTTDLFKCIQTRNWKIQRVNIFGFAGHTVSVSTTQLCLCSVKAATDNM